MTKAEMFKAALEKDLTKHKNAELLLEVLKVQEEKTKPMVTAAKKQYEYCMEQTAVLARSGNAKQGVSWYETAHKFAIWSATEDFDMYMIASEWNREPRARFWLPRRDVLEGKHRVASRIQEFIDDDKALYLSLSTPPGAGKSTLIKFLLSYIAGKFPQSANMYISYSDGMSKMMYDSVSAMLTDTAEYGHNDIFSNGSPALSAEYSTISYRRKGDFPTIGIISLGGSVTGRTRANKFMVTDDLVKNAEVARNPQRLETLWQDYRDTLTTRQIGDNVKQIMLGTIWSLHDPISKMKTEHEGDPRYRFIAIPVCDEDGHSNFEYKCADNYTDKKIQDIKENSDPVTFSCLYMQTPIEREGLVFSEDNVNWYNGILPEGGLLRKIAVCDVAWGGGDFLSMPFAYIYSDGSIYIHSIVYNNKDKNVTQPLVADQIIKNKSEQIRFEANNGGDSYAENIDNELRNRGVRTNITWKKAPTNQSKIGRIMQYAPDIKKMYFRNDKERGAEYGKFLEDLFRFNQNGKNIHDDAPDSLAQLCDFWFNGTATVEVIQRFV